MSLFPNTLIKKINDVKQNHKFRVLLHEYPAVDFSSNDYLGFSTQGYLANSLANEKVQTKTGSTGSRLISGNSTLFTEIENAIAKFHYAESALIYNSGYDANLGLLSSIPQKGDLVLCDELIHASLIDGIRLSFATHFKIKHNNTQHLRDLLERYRNDFNEVYVVVESVYSMDGDCAPLQEIINLSKQYNFHVIVDEAHAIGVFGNQGRGLCNELNIENECFARIYTYGKAMGCHGAAIVGNKELKEYLINFSRSFIYTTALPEHSLMCIKNAYLLLQNTDEIKLLRGNIDYFTQKTNSDNSIIKSKSAIHCKITPGNLNVNQLENTLKALNIFVKSIKSPTVKENQERLRICLHSFNTKEQIDLLIKNLH